MISLLIILQGAVLIGILVLLVRKPHVQPELLGKLGVLDTIAPTLREEFRISREEIATSLQQSRQESTSSARDLRQELIGIVSKLSEDTRREYSDFRKEAEDHASALKVALASQIGTFEKKASDSQDAFRESLTSNFRQLQADVNGSLASVKSEQIAQNDKLKEWIQLNMSRMNAELREIGEELKSTLHSRLEEVKNEVANLSQHNEERQEKLREVVEKRLDKVNETNAAKLEEMRQTVDEKLHSTLEKRLTDSFGLVSDQLGKVQQGLGEMKDIATDVGDLKRVLTNVKARGGLAEVQLGQQLQQILSPTQYIKNARIKPDTQEAVEYAIKLPNKNGDDDLLIPIDAKFPREDWERLEDAYTSGDAQQIKEAGKAFESGIRGEAKRISEKYINPPVSTNFAIMFLPTESLFAEVLRRPGLVDELQQKYKVTVCGPTNFSAFVISLQMGFQTLAIQEKGTQVWNLLAAVKVQFGKFGDLMDVVGKQVGTVQTTLSNVKVRTRAINKKLKNIDTLEMSSSVAASLLEIDEAEDPGKIVQIAASASSGE